MTTYLDIIPLELAKKFLRITGNDFDDVITLLIESSCKTFENQTEVILAQVEKQVYKGKRYYFDPINNTEDVERKSLYFIPKADLTIIAGFEDANDVPQDIKDAILKMIQGKFLAEEANEFYRMGDEVATTINVYKRFWL